MLVLSHSTPISSGFIRPKLSFLHKFTAFNHVQAASTTWSLRCNMRACHEFGIGPHYAIPSGRDYYHSSSNNDLPEEEPFPLPLIRQAQWGIRSLFLFLAEQPSQLKHIEWPEFFSTLKTATLTLVLVAVLIVALASIDSGLSFLLAFILRRPA